MVAHFSLYRAINNKKNHELIFDLSSPHPTSSMGSLQNPTRSRITLQVGLVENQTGQHPSNPFLSVCWDHKLQEKIIIWLELLTNFAQKMTILDLSSTYKSIGAPFGGVKP